MVILQIMDETVEALKAKVAALESELAALKHDIASSLDSLTKESEARIKAEDELAELANQKPVAWAIRVGDSDTWSYADSESDADFYCKQSGLKCEKRPLFAHPPAAAASEDTQDAGKWRLMRETLTQGIAGGVEVNDAKLFYEQPTQGEEVRIYWYPDTPIGFYEVKARTLDDAVDAIAAQAGSKEGR
jgi:hypothetical protein